jgi:hypothetical protein
MGTSNIAEPLRWVRIMLALACIALIVGFTAFALNANPVGYALFGVAGVNFAIDYVLLMVIKNRVQSHVRTLQVQQQADLDRAFRTGTQ